MPGSSHSGLKMYIFLCKSKQLGLLPMVVKKSNKQIRWIDILHRTGFVEWWEAKTFRERCMWTVHCVIAFLVMFYRFNNYFKYEVATVRWWYVYGTGKQSELGLGRYSQYRYSINTDINRYVSIRQSCCTDTDDGDSCKKHRLFRTQNYLFHTWFSYN